MYKLISIIIITMVLTILAVSTVAVATPLTSNRHIFINVANDAGVKYDVDGATYGGDNNTYYIKADGGGLNQLHITTDVKSASGQVTTSTAQSGTFFITTTGGQGYNDDVILMISVRDPLPDNLSVHIRSYGYSWTPSSSVPDSPMYMIGVNETFTRDDFIYGPQTWKPGPGTLGVPSLALQYGQDINDPSANSNLMFVDLNIGNMKSGTFDNGAARVEYSVTNLSTSSAFNVYSWNLNSNQGQGISWTNAVSGTGASGYQVIGISGPPVADFSARTTSVYVDQPIQFTDTSTNVPMTWSWSFGDGGTSTEQNPVHTYTIPGTYTVTLTVTNTKGSATETKLHYMTVTIGVKIIEGQTNLPTDPDKDGKYEDLSGNNETGFADVVIFFKKIEWISENEPVSAFDFSGNGEIGFQDIVLLFKEV